MEISTGEIGAIAVTIFSGIAILSFSGIAILAYREPRIYAKIWGVLHWIMLFAFTSCFSWNLATYVSIHHVKFTSFDIKSYENMDRYVSSIEDQYIPTMWIVMIIVFFFYNFFLDWITIERKKGKFEILEKEHKELINSDISLPLKKNRLEILEKELKQLRNS